VFLYFLQDSTPQPIIIKINDSPPPELVGIGDTIVGAIGLTGVIALLAGLAALLVAGLLFWSRRRNPLSR
jgi:hypothetical protein